VKNKRLFIGFVIGVLSAMFGWCAYTLYQIFSKPVLPTPPCGSKEDIDKWFTHKVQHNKDGTFSYVPRSLTEPMRDEDAEYFEAGMSLDPHSLDDLDKTQPIRLYPNGNRKAVSWIEVMEINYPDVWEKFRATLDDTQPIKVDLEPSAKDLEDWAEYVG